MFGRELFHPWRVAIVETGANRLVKDEEAEGYLVRFFVAYTRSLCNTHGREELEKVTPPLLLPIARLEKKSSTNFH